MSVSMNRRQLLQAGGVGRNPMAEVTIVRAQEEAGEIAASLVVEHLEGKPDAVLGLTTGVIADEEAASLLEHADYHRLARTGVGELR